MRLEKEINKEWYVLFFVVIIVSFSYTHASTSYFVAYIGPSSPPPSDSLSLNMAHLDASLSLYNCICVCVSVMDIDE